MMILSQHHKETQMNSNMALSDSHGIDFSKSKKEIIDTIIFIFSRNISR